MHVLKNKFTSYTKKQKSIIHIPGGKKTTEIAWESDHMLDLLKKKKSNIAIINVSKTEGNHVLKSKGRYYNNIAKIEIKKEIKILT